MIRILLLFITIGFHLHALGQNFQRISELELRLSKEKDHAELIKIYNELSKLQQATSPEKALQYAQQALSLSTSTEFEFGEIQAYHQIGNIQRKKGNYQQAIESHTRALSIAEKLSNQKFIAEGYVMLGKVYLEKGDFETATEYYMETVALGEKAHNLYIKALANAALGELQFSKGSDFLALQYYKQAIEFIEPTGEEELKGDIYNSSAKLFKLLKQPAEALEYYKKALTIFEKLDQKEKEVVICYDIGQIYLSLRQYDESLQYMKSCLALSEITGMRAYRKMSYEKMAEVSEKTGDFEHAYEFLKYFYAIKDTRVISELETKLEHAQLQQEINLLNQRELFHQKEIENRNFLLYIGFGSALIVLVLTLFLFFAFRQKSNINIELQKATEEAIRQRKEKEEFFAYTSHEIRTPLNAVVGMSQLLSETDLNANQQKYLRTISASAKNILFLVNDVLDLSKIESGAITFENVDFSLKEIVDEVIHTLSFKVREKDVKLIAIIDSRVPEVIKGDPIRINQIILNLADNALKFTENGEVKITIKHLGEEEDKVKLHFSVKDTGIGIKKSKLESIFDSYKQENAHTTRQYGGTGLGLAISKELLRLMGSQIQAQSTYGEGAEFFFDLALKKSKTTDFKVSINEDKHLKLKNLDILVVDDNTLNREIFFDLINDYKNNVKVEMAEDGLVAVEMIEKRNYDIVLMDIQMPRMDGFEATKYIRSQLSEDKRNIPVIAMTAHVLDGVAAKCDEAGMNDYVAKPINLRILTQKIKQFVKENNSPLKNEYDEEIKETESFSLETKHTNLAELHALVGGNMAKVEKYIDIFLKSAPKDLEAMKEKLDQKDWVEVGALAHKLKGNVGYMGIHSIKENLLELEKLKTEVGDIDEIADIVDRVEVVIELSMKELQKIKTKLKETT